MHFVCKVNIFGAENATTDKTEQYALQDPIIQEHLIKQYPKAKPQKAMRRKMTNDVRLRWSKCCTNFSTNRKSTFQRIGLCLCSQTETAWIATTDYASEASNSGLNIWTTHVLQLQYSCFLKLVLVFALSMQWRIFTFDITTAFLHTILNPDDDPIFVLSPEEYFDTRSW